MPARVSRRPKSTARTLIAPTTIRSDSAYLILELVKRSPFKLAGNVRRTRSYQQPETRWSRPFYKLRIILWERFWDASSLPVLCVCGDDAKGKARRDRLLIERVPKNTHSQDRFERRCG